MVNQEEFRKSVELRNEIQGAAARIARCVWKRQSPHAEDIVVLRGSTEALIELAEDTECKDH